MARARAVGKRQCICLKYATEFWDVQKNCEKIYQDVAVTQKRNLSMLLKRWHAPTLLENVSLYALTTGQSSAMPKNVRGSNTTVDIYQDVLLPRTERLACCWPRTVSCLKWKWQDFFSESLYTLVFIWHENEFSGRDPKHAANVRNKRSLRCGLN